MGTDLNFFGLGAESYAWQKPNPAHEPEHNIPTAKHGGVAASCCGDDFISSYWGTGRGGGQDG